LRQKKIRHLASRHKLKTLASVLVSALLVTLITLSANTCYQRYALTGPYRPEYEGKILDKSMTITDSHTGSGVSRRLLLEGRSGERFQIAVSEKTYEQAQPGMWIRRSEAGIELNPAGPSNSPR
jgi:hypothetical protein